MISSCRAIVLNSIKFKETSLIVHLYTREYGRISVLVNSAFGTGKHKKGKAGFFQPLSLLDIIIDYKVNRQIQIVREFSTSHVLNTIHFSVDKSLISMFIAEMLYRTVREEEGNQSMFDFIESSIIFLDVSDESYANFHLLFLIKLSKYLGFYPMIDFYTENALFNIKTGIFHSDVVPDYYSVDSVISKTLFDLGGVNFIEMSKVSLSGQRRVKVLEIIIEYYSYHIDSLGVIKSLEVIREIFD